MGRIRRCAFFRFFFAYTDIGLLQIRLKQVRIKELPAWGYKATTKIMMTIILANSTHDPKDKMYSFSHLSVNLSFNQFILNISVASTHHQYIHLFFKVKSNCSTPKPPTFSLCVCHPSFTFFIYVYTYKLQCVPKRYAD